MVATVPETPTTAEANDRRSVQLERGDYYLLRTRLLELQAVESEAQRMAVEMAARRQMAAARLGDAWRELERIYGLDPSLSYRWDDATCALTQEP